MVLAIEADGASYWQSGSVRDRDRLRSEHLQRLGWRYHRLWSTNWFRNPQGEVDRVLQAYVQAVSAPEPGPRLAADADAPRAAGSHQDRPDLGASTIGQPSGPRQQPQGGPVLHGAIPAAPGQHELRAGTGQASLTAMSCRGDGSPSALEAPRPSASASES